MSDARVWVLADPRAGTAAQALGIADALDEPYRVLPLGWSRWAGLPLPGYEMVMKCSHSFNLLDARGAISVTERAAYIGRVRTLARLAAQSYYASRKAHRFERASIEALQAFLPTEERDEVIAARAGAKT